jgi:Response regulator containing a CheY-like receiver domain and an HTH DNA-binding domain
MSQATLIIADNQPLTATGLKTWAENSGIFSSVLELSEKQTLTEYLQEVPDDNVLLIIDMELFDFSGRDELALFFEEHKFLRKLFIGDRFKEEQLSFITERIGSNVILKNIDMEELDIAVNFTLKRRYYIQSELLSLLMRNNAAPSKPNNLNVCLTPTERDITTFIVNGKTTKEIAMIRNLSYHTVMTHRKNIFRKLGVCSIHELTVYAIKVGLIDPTEYYI